MGSHAERLLRGLGVGNLRFGMSRSDLRRFWGEPTEDGSRGGARYEWYADRYCFVYFDLNGDIDAIEFGRGAVDLMCDGVSLFALSGAEFVRWLTSRDPKARDWSSGFLSHQLGICAYAPFLTEEPDELVGGITVFKAGAVVMRDIERAQ